MAVRYIIASGKGGAGKSSVTAGVARALAGRGKKVLCIDADIGQKSLDLLLHADERIVFNWADAIVGLCSYENALIQTGANGPALVIPPSAADDRITADSFRLMIEAYSDGFDYILIDLPAGRPEIFDCAFAVADRALLVCTPDAVCTRSAAAMEETIRQAVPDLRLVVNRFDKEASICGRQMGLDACVDRVSAQLIGVIPEDSSVAQTLLGKNLSEYVYSAFKRTAARMEGENIPLKSKYF